MEKLTKEARKEENNRIKKLKEHFETGGYKSVFVEILDYKRTIGVCIKTNEYSYPFHFPASLSDDEIIKETEDTLNSNGASEYSLVDWRPYLPSDKPRKLKPGGAI